MVSSSASAIAPHLHPRRRSSPRYALRSLSYVKLDQANGGIIRDLTEKGIALQAVTPLVPGNDLALRFDLFSPRAHVEVHGRVMWADPSGQAGIRFTDLSPRQVRALREWILFQILSAAAASGRDSIFSPLDQQIMLSAAARPAILLDLSIPVPDLSGAIRWGMFSLSLRSFSILVDTVVVACAILLFSISSLAVMGNLPPWPISAALFMVASVIFIAIYQVIFSEFLCGASPGKRLAVAASGHPDDGSDQRFR